MKNTFRFFGIIALAALIGFSMAGCSSPTGSDDNSGTVPAGSTEITIAWLQAHNWTVGDPVKTSSYTCGAWLEIPSPRNLIILPGTTITFTAANAGFLIQDGAAIYAVGLPYMLDLNSKPTTTSGRIILQGQGSGKGRWFGIEVDSTGDNEISYVDIQAAGSEGYNGSAAVLIYNGKLSITNCLINNSGANGIVLGENSGLSAAPTEITEFRDNIISNCAISPISTISYAFLYHLRNLSNSNPFDKWTGNGKNYVYISQCGNVHAPGDFTLPSLRNLNTGSATVYTTIPWYISDNISIASGATDYNLSIAAGAEIWMAPGTYIYVPETKYIRAVGTPAAPIKFKAASTSWDNIQIVSGTSSGRSILNYCEISGAGSDNKGVISMWAGPSNSNNCYLEMSNTTLNSSDLWLYLDGNGSGICHITSTTPITDTTKIGGPIASNLQWN